MEELGAGEPPVTVGSCGGRREKAGVQFLLFASVGAVGTVGHFAVLIALVHLRLSDPLVASAAGFVAGALINYCLNYRVTFRCRRPHRAAMPRFFAVALAGLGLNSLLMLLTTPHLHYLAAQALATLGVLGWNFICNRFWTFGGTVW